MCKQEAKSKEGMSISLALIFGEERSWESWLAFKEDILEMHASEIYYS
jgi:hypothetical protein